MSEKRRKIIIGILIVLIIICVVCYFYFKGQKTYTISFDTDGGTATAAINVRNGNKIAKPSNPTKEGYEFVEWQLNGKTYNFDTPIEGNATLTAVWKKADESIEHFTVTFNTNGGNDIQSQNVASGEKATLPETPIKEKYTFVEWQLSGKKYDFSTPVTANITLDAKWKEAEVEKFTITFNTDGGSTVKSQTIESGKKVTKPTNPTKKGYTFVEWQLNNELYDFNTLVTGDITLVAKWSEEVINKYTVTFNTDGGNTIKAQTVESGKTVTKPTDPTKEGYTFVEWQLNGKTYSFSTPVTSNITLTAKWVQNSMQKFTVKFDSNGGSSVSAQIVAKGLTASKPADPTKSGYTFVEWQLNGSAYNFSTPVTSNITLTAKWNQNVVQKYTVSFNSNGGSSVSSQTVNSGSTATKPSNPTKSGYTFVEWQLNGSAYNFSTPVTGNITLTAKWSQKTYTIKAVPKDDYSPYLDLYVYENGTKISVYALYYASDGAKLTGFSENKNTLEDAYLVQLTSGGEKFRANVVK